MVNGIVFSTVLALATLNLAQGDQTRYSVADLREDFSIYRHALEEGHPGLYRYTPKREMDALFDRANESIKSPMTSLEFFRLIAPIQSAVKCGHTRIIPSKADRAQVEKTPLLPFSVVVIENKAFVYRDLTDTPAHPGAEIRSINGVQTPEIVKKVENTMECDADVKSLKPYRLSASPTQSNWRFNTSLLTVLGMAPPYEVDFRDEDGRASHEMVAGFLRSELMTREKSKYPQDNRELEPAELAFADNGKVAVMTIRSFDGPASLEGKLDLKTFYEQSFAQMELKHTERLILDLRGNGGGSDETGMQLLQHLVDKPFTYYADLILNNITFKFTKYGPPKQPRELPKDFAELGADGKYHNLHHPNNGTHDPAKPVFLGRLFVLADGGSFSTTCEFTSNLRYRRKTTFIGEETGGAFYGNNSGAVAQVILPHTGVTFYVPLMEYVMAVSGEPKRRGILPDVPVKRSVEDMLAGRDRGMEVALRLAKQAS